MQSSGGLVLSPRSGAGGQQAGGGSSSELRDGDGVAFEQEVVQLMENNMTTAMQYLQSKGLCLMPIALASAISDTKGASSAAVRPEGSGGTADDGADAGGGRERDRDGMEMLRAVRPLGTPREMKSRA